MLGQVTGISQRCLFMSSLQAQHALWSGGRTAGQWLSVCRGFESSLHSQAMLVLHTIERTEQVRGSSWIEQCLGWPIQSGVVTAAGARAPGGGGRNQPPRRSIFMVSVCVCP